MAGQQTAHARGVEVSRTLGRRTAALWLSIAVGIAAWVTGLAMTAAALGVAIACGLIGRGVRSLRRSTYGRSPGGRFTAPTACAAWALAATVAVAAPDELRAVRALHGLRHVSEVTVLGHTTDPAMWATIIDLLVAGALVSSLFLAQALRRPSPFRGERSQAALDRARAIVSEWGEDSLSPYILRPDKEFEFVGDGVVAFSVIGDTVVISADPVGPPQETARALESLVGRARRARLRVAAYGMSAAHLDTVQALGLHAVRAGEEAVVDPGTFSLEGRAVRKLRQSVHRVDRQGWSVVLREGREIDSELQLQIDDAEARWREQHQEILGFAMSMGEFELSIRPDDLYVLAFSPAGQLQGLLRFLAHRRRLSLDVMRRVGPVPNGLIEALVCHALEFARTRDVDAVSLNYAGLAHLLRPDAPGNRLAKAAVLRARRPMRRRFQMDRLVQFNQKFSPEWQPRYLVFDSRLGLPRTVVRVLQAEGYLGRKHASLWHSTQPRARPVSPTIKQGAGG